MSPPSDANDRDLHKNRPYVGAAPGTLVLPEGSPPPLIYLTRFNEDECVEESIQDPSEIPGWLSDDHVLWIDVQGLGDESILYAIAEVFDIHPLALEDIVHVPQRPKTDIHANHRLIFARMLSLTEDHEVDMEQVSLVVGKNYIISFQERPGDVLDPIRRRLANSRTRLRRSRADFLAYALCDTIVDAYFPVIEQIGDRLDELEDQVFTGAQESILQDLSELRTTLMAMRRSIWPLRDAINQLTHDYVDTFGSDVRPFLQDLHDHCVNAGEMVETYRELSSGLLNSYLSVVSHKMNEVMQVLTVVSTIFIPLTFLTGLYGMNFRWMPELGWKISYPILLGIMATTSISLLIYFRRRGWLGGTDVTP